MAKQLALVLTCVDDRLDHAKLRAQVFDKLSTLHKPCDHVFIVTEIGGNIGTSFTNTVNLFRALDGNLVMAAVLHHDSCLAFKHGLSKPLAQSVADVEAFLTQEQAFCLLGIGLISTQTNEIDWHEVRRINVPS